MGWIDSEVILVSLAAMLSPTTLLFSLFVLILGDRPLRTGIGVGVLTFYIVLTVAGAQDIIAQKLGVSIVPLTWTLRVLVFALPVLLGLLARRVCRALQAEHA